MWLSYRAVAIVALNSSALLWMTGQSSALMTAARPSVVNPSAATDPTPGSSEYHVAVAGAGGVFVTVYSSTDSLNGTIGSDYDILAVRSTDAGRTWSDAVAVDSEAATDGALNLTAGLSTNGEGVWNAVWDANGDALLAARSVDNGATWNSRTVVAAGGVFPDVASSGSASVTVWQASNVPGYGSDHDIFYARSGDAGGSWSAPAALNPGAASDVATDLYPRVTTDGGGNWVAVWEEVGIVRAVRSTDDGLTWGSSVVLGPKGDSGGLNPVDVATDRDGRWIAIWETYGVSSIEGISGGDTDLAYAMSTDAGFTWSTPKALLGDATTDDAYERRPRLEANSQGGFQAVWSQSLDSFGGTVGNDSDIFGSRSLDGGAHWSGRALVNANGSHDVASFPGSYDSEPDIAVDQAGNWVVAWMSTDSLDQTIGADSDVLANASHDDCPAAPRSDCASASTPRGSRLTIKNGPGGKDRLIWTWAGLGTVAADLGDPTAGGGYVLCLYDKVGADQRQVLEMDALGAATCNAAGSACWSATATGFRYKDSTNRNGATKAFTATAGAGESGKFRATGTGPTLSLPSLPLSLAPQVQAQVINTATDACWSATYSAAVRNDASQFKARSD